MKWSDLDTVLLFKTEFQILWKHKKYNLQQIEIEHKIINIEN